MDEDREGTEYELEPGSIEWYRQKYPRSDLEWKPASMRKGSDKLAFFWIAYFGIILAVLFYLGTHGGL
ncbi:hypothetical protein [Streptomyces pharetrae]|uniref:hypothetical protein n=1 Tax=Streptomyces pharetrae TaxID=291370 RepID=UPI003650CC50